MRREGHACLFALQPPRGVVVGVGGSDLDVVPKMRARWSIAGVSRFGSRTRVCLGMTVSLGCLRPANSCAWSPHNHKHFPIADMKPKHTVRPNAARYLAVFDGPSIRALETATARDAFRLHILPGGKAEYRRDVGEVIGWDDGKEATFSFVECSGGAGAGRAYHGRPMHPSNPKLSQDP